MLDVSWADLDKESPLTKKTKKCRYCKLVKPISDFGRWPDCEDGLHYFCIECWDGFCKQGKPHGKSTLVCFKCNKEKTLKEFYRECVFGTFAPWCNSCRSAFIAEHATPKPQKLNSPRPPRPPQAYTCQRCHAKKLVFEFGFTESGKRNSKCSLCREDVAKNKVKVPKPKIVKCASKTKECVVAAMNRAENLGTQICSVCAIEKPLSEFPSDKRKPRGVAYSCNQCIQNKHKTKTRENSLMLAYSVQAEARAANFHDLPELFIEPKTPQQPIELFRCRKCQQNKPLTEFAKAPRKCGHDLWCKECSKERKRKWRIENKYVGRNKSWEEKSVERCKRRAREKNLPFDMKPSDLYDTKTGALPIFCPIFKNIRLDYNHGPDRRAWASVDKIVPQLGYVTGNVWVVSNSANIWKNNGSNPEERLRIVEIMAGKNNNTHKNNHPKSPMLF